MARSRSDIIREARRRRPFIEAFVLALAGASEPTHGKDFEQGVRAAYASWDLIEAEETTRGVQD